MGAQLGYFQVDSSGGVLEKGHLRHTAQMLGLELVVGSPGPRAQAKSKMSTGVRHWHTTWHVKV